LAEDKITHKNDPVKSAILRHKRE